MCGHVGIRLSDGICRDCNALTYVDTHVFYALIPENKRKYAKCHPQMRSYGRYGRCKTCYDFGTTLVGKERHLFYIYGITLDQFEKLKQHQHYTCAICENTPDKWVVDHDHATGEVRSLLCDSCNKGLGFFKDNVSVMEQAINYVLSGGKLFCPDVREL